MTGHFLNNSIGVKKNTNRTGTLIKAAFLQSKSLIRIAILFIFLGLNSPTIAQAEEQSDPGLANIISQIGVSTTKSARDGLISDFLDVLIDRRGLQKYFSNRGDLALKISRNLDGYLTKLPRGVTFSADLVASVFVDFAADELMQYIVSKQGNFWGGKAGAYTTAASLNVIIKQSYIYATSGGNQIKVLVGQASLLIDIALKDVEAYREYSEVKDIAEHAELRADMWNAYGDYIQSFATANTQAERNLAKQAFNGRLQQVSNAWNLNDDIIAPGPGALDSQGNRPGDTRFKNTSDLAFLFDKTLKIFTTLQETSPLFSEPSYQYDYPGPYAVPEFDFRSILDNPIDDDTETSSPFSNVGDKLRDNELFATKNDSGEVVIGNNAGTSIKLPSPPIITPPVETAAERAARLQREAEERARLARERLAAIDSLIATRNSLSIVRIDAEGRIQNNQNRLTVLRFNELEKVQNISGTVDAEIARLRSIRSTSALSSADETRFQNLLVYQVTLENEQDRIARDIRTSEAAITQYETARNQAVTDLASNGQQLTNRGYNLNGYIAPNVDLTGLIDWTTYKYEIPPFIQTEVPATSTQLGFITAAKASPTSTFLLTHGATATKTSNGATLSSTDGSLMITATNPDVSYAYLAWGVFSGPISFTDTNTGKTHSLENVRWLYGDATPANYFLNKTGTAFWAGNVYGDYALNGTSRTFYNAVVGDVDFSVNFSDNSVRGTLSTNTNYSLSSLTSVSSSSFFDISGNFMTGNINGVSGGGVSTQILGFGSTVGELGGAFFGPNAEEFGGTFWYNDGDGGASGIVAALPSTPDTQDYSKYRGLVAIGSSLVSGGPLFLTFGSVESVTSNGTVKFSGSTDDQTIKDHSRNTGKSFDSDPYVYDHLNWGEWGGANFSVSTANGQKSGIAALDSPWLVYEPTQNLQRSGFAEYSGELDGLGSDGSLISGNVSMSADFARDKISGGLVFEKTHNLEATPPSDWGRANFDTTIRRDANSSGFQGNLTGGDVNSGVVFGGFSGPNAEEIGGGWQLDHNDGSSAIGIFRVHQ